MGEFWSAGRKATPLRLGPRITVTAPGAVPGIANHRHSLWRKQAAETYPATAPEAGADFAGAGSNPYFPEAPPSDEGACTMWFRCRLPTAWRPSSSGLFDTGPTRELIPPVPGG